MAVVRVVSDGYRKVLILVGYIFCKLMAKFDFAKTINTKAVSCTSIIKRIDLAEHVQP